MTRSKIGLEEARELVRSRIRPLPPLDMPLWRSLYRFTARETTARVDCPSVNSSLKDGYAVRSADLAAADREAPVRLRLTDNALFAGGGESAPSPLHPGTAMRIMTGAELPPGADAVAPQEAVDADGEVIEVPRRIEPGADVLLKGSDIRRNDVVLAARTRIDPNKLGLLAAAGLESVPAHPAPKVGLIATGDELMLPGRPPARGKLYASNLVTLYGWCAAYGIDTLVEILPDEPGAMRDRIRELHGRCDALLTSGGAWSGDRDFVLESLESLQWNQVFHRVRLGPGKGVSFGLLQEKPVFVLPGGPPSNLVAFLQLGLFGLQLLSGNPEPGLPRRKARLQRPVRGQSDWTQFVFGELREEEGSMRFLPLNLDSRLRSMARSCGMVCIPEGTDHIPEGADVEAQVWLQPEIAG
jgi:molybdopterin molybdotransferase